MSSGSERTGKVIFICYKYIYLKLNQLHAVSRTQQGRQREPSVKSLRYPLSAEFWRHCVLNGRNQLRALSRHQSEENENINLSKFSSPRIRSYFSASLCIQYIR